MKPILVFFIVGLLGSGANAQTDQKKVEQAVIDWAKSTFEFFDAPRFEKFEPIPSPDYFALTIQREGLIEFKQEIIFNFGEGKSDRTKEKLKEDTLKLNKNIADLDRMLEIFEPKYDGFEIMFWANIRTNNGLTVYYQHRVIVTSGFKVKSAKITSRIGQENDQVKIVYKN